MDSNAQRLHGDFPKEGVLIVGDTYTNRATSRRRISVEPNGIARASHHEILRLVGVDTHERCWIKTSRRAVCLRAAEWHVCPVVEATSYPPPMGATPYLQSGLQEHFPPKIQGTVHRHRQELRHVWVIALDVGIEIPRPIGIDTFLVT